MIGLEPPNPGSLSLSFPSGSAAVEQRAGILFHFPDPARNLARMGGRRRGHPILVTAGRDILTRPGG